MNEVEKYLFDIQGYLIIEDVLTADEVADLNRGAVDAQNLPDPGLESREGRFGNFLDWGTAFCNLLDHPKLMPYLKALLGDGFRLDHYYGIYLREGAGPLNLHGGSTPYDPPEYYHFRDNKMYNGLVVVGWNLSDTGPEHGGFCCIPGSHKANCPLPDVIRQQHYQALGVVTPAVKAGSLVIFTEALTHGTTPWWGKHERRSLLYKYSPGQQSWGANYPQPPTAVTLTARQQLLFEKPYFNARPSLFNEESSTAY